MAFQSRQDFTNYPFILGGEVKHRDNETIVQDAGRTTPLKFGTVLAQNAATRKWTPLTDAATSANGLNVARGIYYGEEIPAADIAAGDVTGAIIIVYGAAAIVDAQQLVLENSLTLNTVASDDPAGADNGVVNVRRIEDDLLRIGIMAVGTYDIDTLENA